MSGNRVSLAPTWSAVLPIYLEVIQKNDPDSPVVAAAMQELRRMAEAADKWNAARAQEGQW